MLPFDTYPNGGSEPFCLKKGYNTRLVDGPEFMKRTGQITCAYCGANFLACYEIWLTMVLDHVIPASVCLRLQKDIPLAWSEDFFNMVLSCGACNGFCNRYSYLKDIALPLNHAAFVELRNSIFMERKDLISTARQKEFAHFKEMQGKFKMFDDHAPIGEESKRNGTDKMTEAEIDAVIQEYRSEKQANSER